MFSGCETVGRLFLVNPWSSIKKAFSSFAKSKAQPPSGPRYRAGLVWRARWECASVSRQRHRHSRAPSREGSLDPRLAQEMLCAGGLQSPRPSQPPRQAEMPAQLGVSRNPQECGEGRVSLGPRMGQGLFINRLHQPGKHWATELGPCEGTVKRF